MPLSRSKDLHGSAPDKCTVALLLIDWINDLEFESGDKLLPAALAAAKPTAALRRRAKEARVPVIYCNDNFGKWRSDFRSLLEHCLEDDVRGRPIAELLKPDEDDYFVLKPKHDAYMRDFKLIVPRDCVASENDADNRHALEHMATACKADTGPASGIDFAKLQKAA
jgi:isochorismate hydrolase